MNVVAQISKTRFNFPSNLDVCGVNCIAVLVRENANDIINCMFCVNQSTNDIDTIRYLVDMTITNQNRRLPESSYLAL